MPQRIFDKKGKYQGKILSHEESTLDIDGANIFFLIPILIVWGTPIGLIGYLGYHLFESYKVSVVFGVIALVLLFFIRKYLNILVYWVSLVIIYLLYALMIAGAVWCLYYIWSHLPS